ncbi:MAG: DNA polymerase III subunit epsilon [Lautropia sp.]|nr:DNA polymerase III subunit epsilon [Lautropia sp.]
MRQITLDTETTGLEYENGHRIIEIGCVEVVERRLTRRNLHFYLNPEREIDAAAPQVHGLALEDLRGKPRFSDIAEEFLAFCQGAEIIIHNAAFDIGFLDAELSRLGRGLFRDCCCSIVDTLALAKEQFPGKRNNLDALCERLMVPNAHRKVHGALLDAELLAEVYLGLTRGQGTFEIALQSGAALRHEMPGDEDWPPADLVVLPASVEELQAHAALLQLLARHSGKAPLWSRWDTPAAEQEGATAAPPPSAVSATVSAPVPTSVPASLPA